MPLPLARFTLPMGLPYRTPASLECPPTLAAAWRDWRHSTGTLTRLAARRARKVASCPLFLTKVIALFFAFGWVSYVLREGWLDRTCDHPPASTTTSSR